MDLVRDSSTALVQFGKNSYGIFLLDGELKDQPISALTQNLYSQRPDIRVIVILGNNSDETVIKKLPGVDAVFIKPFHIQELVRRVNQIAREFSIPSRDENIVQPGIDLQLDTSWIDDRETIQENLVRLAFRSPAQAVMVFLENKMWVQASRLENDLNQRVVDQFVRAWDKRSGLDLIRYFKDKDGISTWMLYGTGLVKQYSLVMVFPGVSMLHEVRGEVIRMANGLSDASLYDNQRKDEAEFLKAVKEGSEAKERKLIHQAAGSAPRKRTGQLKKKTGKTFRFTLIPKEVTTLLKGDLADSLNIWVPQICDAQHWELIELEIEQKRMQITLALFPDQSAERVAAYMKDKTTEMVFKLFPLQKIRGDFWNGEVLIVDVEKEIPAFLSETGESTAGLNQEGRG